jgi:ATP adenylyltransferase
MAEDATSDNGSRSAGWLDQGLWRSARRVAERACKHGAMAPIKTRRQTLSDGGLPFVVRIVESLRDKARLAAPAGAAGANLNPFLPYEPELFVGDVGPDHVALLNKYNVVREHLLIVTRTFQSQEALLTRADFAALALCMTAAESEPLGFYNSGRVAGASQAHRHLQLVPLFDVDSTSHAPLDPLIRASVAQQQLGTADLLPFSHSVARIDEQAVGDMPQHLHELYVELLRRQQLLAADSVTAESPAGPYNLLLTRRWMLLVPRVRESFRGISLNALAFGGALLVKDDQQLDVLRGAGPLAALQAAAR